MLVVISPQTMNIGSCACFNVQLYLKLFNASPADRRMSFRIFLSLEYLRSRRTHIAKLNLVAGRAFGDISSKRLLLRHLDVRCLAPNALF
jgi:hypothetical protein